MENTELKELTVYTNRHLEIITEQLQDSHRVQDSMAEQLREMTVVLLQIKNTLDNNQVRPDPYVTKTKIR